MAGLSTKDAIELYETVKHRRYGLLFSVNGAAFAIAKLLAGDPGKDPVARLSSATSRCRSWPLE